MTIPKHSLRCGLVVALLLASACSGARTPATRSPATPTDSVAAQRLPTIYLADRFAMAPVTADGDTLVLYTDTGGGLNMLWESTVRRLRYPTERQPMGNDTASLVTLPPLSPGATIPLPQPIPPFGERFYVAPESQQGFARDGFLGRTWFADRVWIFDYPGRTLSIVTSGDVRTGASAHSVPLGFQTDSGGIRTTHFPRIRVEIDGDSLDLLFDTGATIALSDAALTQLADGGPAERGGSFITQQIFERWRSRHPDWLVIEGADRMINMPIIRVPEISVGGYVVGPVWFAMRPDRNFHQFMSQWMDRRIDGALGGSAFRYFRVTADYPRAVALFERP